jgi:class 3 adenylate cyclase
LPDGSGLDVCRSLRADPRTERIPVAMFTAQSSPGIQLEALEAGADDFVPKPFTGSVLRARLANLVGRYRQRLLNEELLVELSRFLPDPIRADGSLDRGPRRVHATILFSDLRGFTAKSFDHELEDFFEGMNHVLAEQADIVRKNGGYVDKFGGDSMLAVFPDADGAEQACDSATEILRWAESDHGISLWPDLPIAIGVHCGDVMQGNLGTQQRREFTVLGPNVNIASRLCGIAGKLEVMISEDVVSVLAPGRAIVEHGQTQLRGLPAPIGVLRLVLE